MPPVIDDKKCKKCGICSDACPVDVFYGSKAKELPVVTYGEDCFFCTACVLECPTDAIRLRYPLYAQPSYLSDSK
jgi:adenylylsulfate reductase, subunit B